MECEWRWPEQHRSATALTQGVIAGGVTKNKFSVFFCVEDGYIASGLGFKMKVEEGMNKRASGTSMGIEVEGGEGESKIIRNSNEFQINYNHLSYNRQ